MVCNNCSYQSPDGLNFCPNCGIAFNPQFARPYQPPQSFQQFNPGYTEVSPAEKSDKNIFTLGIIAFSVKMFWFLFVFLGLRFFGGSDLIYKSISLITSLAVLLFAFIFVKKQSYKTLLVIFFILLFLVEIYQLFFRGYAMF